MPTLSFIDGLHSSFDILRLAGSLPNEIGQLANLRSMYDTLWPYHNVSPRYLLSY